MGCTSGRPEMSPVEARFYFGEIQLNYQKHSATEIDLIHRKYSNEGTVNENQWEEISKCLGLAYSRKPSDKIKSFYASFKSNESYKFQDLLVLGIVLSDSPNELKAGLIFEAFSETSSEISRRKIGRMHDVLYKNSVKRSLGIIADDLKDRPSAEEWKAYLERLKNGRDGFREHFVFSIAADGESVSREGFLNYFRDDRNVLILTASGFRKTLVSFDPVVISQKSHEDLTSRHHRNS